MTICYQIIGLDSDTLYLLISDSLTDIFIFFLVIALWIILCFFLSEFQNLT